MLETKRLIIRQWTKDDYVPFAMLNGDQDVMEFFPATLSQKESDEMATQIISLINLNGYGFWAVELKSTNEFIGFVGLHIPNADLPFSPCVEIGWRLEKKFWGRGYATEAAREVLQFAFESLKLKEVVSFTPVANKRSQALMLKLGLRNTELNFMHPDVDINNLLCEHVLYKITKSQWAVLNI